MIKNVQPRGVSQLLYMNEKKRVKKNLPILGRILISYVKHYFKIIYVRLRNR